jgi:hypothetical protein
MHKSGNGAGKVTAKGLLPSARIAGLHENCLKRDVAMACSGDHYRRRQKTIHEFREQRDAHLNSFGCGYFRTTANLKKMSHLA